MTRDKILAHYTKAQLHLNRMRDERDHSIVIDQLDYAIYHLTRVSHYTMQLSIEERQPPDGAA